MPYTNPALKLNTITGAPPSIQEDISGCKFHPRCEFFEKGLCDSTEIVLEEKLPKHYSACIRF